MKPSNVQTKSIIFGGVDVQPEAADFEDTQVFSWVGVKIGIKTQHERQGVDSYAIFLQFQVLNEQGKQCPYRIDVSALGLFDFVGNEPEEKVADLITVNGLSILYASIRELVTTVTSRMPHGAICLPGANFLDHRPSLQKATETALEKGGAKKSRRKPASDTPGQ